MHVLEQRRQRAIVKRGAKERPPNHQSTDVERERYPLFPWSVPEAQLTWRLDGVSVGDQFGEPLRASRIETHEREALKLVAERAVFELN